MGAVTGWFNQLRYTYFDNAASRKDFRVQLRGPRTLILWTIYLLLLGFIAYLTYSSSTQGNDGGQVGKIPLDEAQNNLQSFYTAMLGLLGGMIVLVAPAIGASAILTERNQGLLDILFSSPISYRYYLAGKLISSYRYIWMLMILAIPIVAVGAVMGGATYTDVFETYLVLSLDGLIFASVALAISAGAVKLSSAVIMGYLSTGALIFVASLFSIGPMASGFMGRSGGPMQMSVLGLVSPFQIGITIQSVTEIGGTMVPNWLLFIPVALLIVQTCLLGAVSSLSRKSTAATTFFRILLLVVVAFLAYSIVQAVDGIGPLSRAGGSGSYTPEFLLFVFDSAVVLVLGIPLASCFSAEEPAKFAYDGAAKIRNTLRANPSGAVFYSITVSLAILVGVALNLATNGRISEIGSVVDYSIWFTGVLMIGWAFSRLSSQLAGTLAAARTMSIAMILLFTGILGAFANMVSSSSYESNEVSPIEPLAPMLRANPQLALGWGVILIVAAILLGLIQLKSFFQRLPPPWIQSNER